MYIKVIPSTSAYNALRYIHKAGSERIATDLVGRSPWQLAQEIKLHNTLGPKIKHEVIHIPMSAAMGEYLAAEKWLKVSQKVMKDLGYEGCPFDLVRHLDKEFDHAHLVVTPIAPDGSRVDRRGDHFRAERVGREIERELGLVQIKGLAGQKERREVERDLEIPRLTMLADMDEIPRQGEPAGTGLRDAIESAIRRALLDSRTFTDLAKQLMKSGVRMEATISKAGKVTGLGYRLYGDQGGYIQASKVHESFSFAKLQKKHGISFEESRDLPNLRAGAIVAMDDLSGLLAGGRTPISGRLNRTVKDLSRHLMLSMNRRANANTQITQPWRADTSRAYRSTAIRLYHAGISGQLPAGEPSDGSRSIVLSRRPLPERMAAPGGGSTATEQAYTTEPLGDSLSQPAPGLAGSLNADQGAGRGQGVPAQDGPRPDLDVSSSSPAGGEGISAPGTVGAGLPAALGGDPGGGSSRSLGPASSGTNAGGVPDASGGPHGSSRAEEAPTGGAGADRLGGMGGPGSLGGVRSESEQIQEEVTPPRRLQVGSGDPDGLEPGLSEVTAPWGTVVEFERARPDELGDMVWAVEADARSVDPALEDHNLAALEVVEQGFPDIVITLEERAKGPLERVAAFVRRAWERLEELVRGALASDARPVATASDKADQDLLIFDEDDIDTTRKAMRKAKEEREARAPKTPDYTERSGGSERAQNSGAKEDPNRRR